MQKKSSKIKTIYGPIAHQVLEHAKYIRLLICDVDGVMSDGLLYISNHNIEMKAFNVRDGYGIRCLLELNIEVAIITNQSTSQLIEKRCLMLGVRHVYQNQSDKNLAFKTILNKLNLMAHQVAYIGDDLIDMQIMNQVGLSVAVADAHPLLKSKVDYITCNNGGRGAVREVCDLILIAQDKLKNIK